MEQPLCVFPEYSISIFDRQVQLFDESVRLLDVHEGIVICADYNPVGANHRNQESQNFRIIRERIVVESSDVSPWNGRCSLKF